MDPSRAKQRVRSLYRQIESRLNVVLGRCPLFAASVYEQKAQCGKPQCKCAKSAYRHRLWCVSFTDQGKSRTRVVGPEIRPQVETLTRDYRRFRQARRDLVKLFEQLLAEADKVGRARRQAGYKRYTRLAAKAPAAGAKKRKARTR